PRDPSQARPDPRWEHEHQRRPHRREEAHGRAALRNGPCVEGDVALSSSQIGRRLIHLSRHSLQMREPGFAVLITLTVALSACGPRLDAVPSPTETLPPVCSQAPSFGLPIDASYPSGVLENQQGMVPVVGMHRLGPMQPALEYFAGRRIAHGPNT